MRVGILDQIILCWKFTKVIETSSATVIFFRRFRDKRITIFDDKVSDKPNLIFVQHLEPPKVINKTTLDYLQGKKINSIDFSFRNIL